MREYSREVFPRKSRYSRIFKVYLSRLEWIETVAQMEARCRQEGLLQGPDDLAALLETRQGRRGDDIAGWDGIEIPGDEFLGPGDLDVADDGQHGVGRDIVAHGESPNVGLGEVLEVLARPEHGMSIGKIGIQVRVENGKALEIGIGGQAAAVGLDQVHLGPFDGLAVDRKRPHPVGFEPEGERHLIGGEGFIEERLVQGRIGVEFAAGFLDEVQLLERADVFRPLEHQVLHEVGQADLSPLLPDRSGAVGHDNRNEGEPAVFRKDNAQAVVQPVLVDREIPARRKGLLRPETRRGRGDEDRGHEDPDGFFHNWRRGRCAGRTSTITQTKTGYQMAAPTRFWNHECGVERPCRLCYLWADR